MHALEQCTCITPAKNEEEVGKFVLTWGRVTVCVVVTDSHIAMARCVRGHLQVNNATALGCEGAVGSSGGGGAGGGEGGC